MKDDYLRKSVVQLHHDHLSAGHPERWKTYKLVSRNYWWPGMSPYVRKYITGCDTCQKAKASKQKPFEPLQPNQIPSKPWEIITIDLITQLTPSKGFDAICVVVDRFTKRARFFAIKNTFSAEDLTDLLYRHIWPLHSLADQIISDRGVQFSAQLFQD